MIRLCLSSFFLHLFSCRPPSHPPCDKLAPIPRLHMLLQCHHLPSPGLRISSLSLTRAILLEISLALSDSRFVLMFELHDNSLKGFPDTAIISRSSPPFALSQSKCSFKRGVPVHFFILIPPLCFCKYHAQAFLLVISFHRAFVRLFWLPGQNFSHFIQQSLP